MTNYHVNTNSQPTGEHEVHQEDCPHSPLDINRIQLGYFTNCFGAVSEAKNVYLNVDGCAYCCPHCHTR